LRQRQEVHHTAEQRERKQNDELVNLLAGPNGMYSKEQCDEYVQAKTDKWHVFSRI
jgi:hypothetical protein